MLKKIAIFLFVLLVVQMVMYARLYAADLVNQAEKITTKITGEKSGADEDIDAYLNNLGIETSVDENVLHQKYQGTELLADPVSGNTTINFSNPDADSYNLEIYDVSKGLVASFVNISTNKVVIDKELFASGAYIFKLEGEENLYCGTFVLR
ncbi:MAG: hypothetical protein SH857_06810 [Chitinophagales bacterium]|nr:hypothetical protein [Chitinophagales bacterium]